MNESLLCYINLNNNTNCLEETELYILAISNAVLAVPTAAGNALVIVAILTTSSLRTPSYLLLTSLASSDLTVGICTQPVVSAMMFGILLKRKITIYLIATLIIGTVLTSCVSVLTLTAISVDRYLAIRLKMRYRSVVTARRGRAFILMAWAIGALMTSYVLIFRRIDQILAAISVVCITICLFIILFCYTMSFRALKIHCAQVQPQGNQQPNSTTLPNAINILKYRKLLKTMILVFTLVFICYLPLLAFFSMIMFRMFEGLRNFLIVYCLLISIVSVHSTLNPLLYITRMGDLRRACTRVLKKLCFR